MFCTHHFFVDLVGIATAMYFSVCLAIVLPCTREVPRSGEARFLSVINVALGVSFLRTCLLLEDVVHFVALETDSHEIKCMYLPVLGQYLLMFFLCARWECTRLVTIHWVPCIYQPIEPFVD